MKDFLKTSLTIFISFVFCSCANVSNSYSQINPRTSAFVKVYRSVTVLECADDKCPKVEWVSTGSGISLFMTGDSTTFLTAGHLCQVPKERLMNNIKKVKISMSVLDHKKRNHHVEILKSSFGDAKKGEPDICLLISSSNIEGIPKVKFSNRGPRVGEQIYSMAAPVGIYHPPVVPIFIGAFSGDISKASSLITIPSAGGSSGAPVLNRRNEVVGVIYAMSSVFHGITLSTNYESTKKFLQDSKKLLEFRCLEEK